MNSNPIPWLEHLRWLENVLSNLNRQLLIGCVGSIAVGVARFDLEGSTLAEVSLYLDPDLHGLGLGRHLLLAGERYVCGQTGRPLSLVADILENNEASCKTFASCGYSLRDGRWRKGDTNGRGSAVRFS